MSGTTTTTHTVASAAELAAAEAEVADQRRLLDQRVVDAVRTAGFARYFVPAKWGGGQGSFRQLVRDAAEVGAGCASAGWYASLSAAVSRMAGFLPEPGQREIWQQGPDVLLAGALVPSGEAEVADGGWRLSGQWPYVSAVEHADWTLARSTVSKEDGSKESRFFLLRRDLYRTIDTWRSAGMRATASNNLRVDEVFVPNGHSFLADDLVAGRAAPDSDPRLQVPLRAVNGLSFTAPMLGAARGALADWWELVGGRLGGQDAGSTDRAIAVSRAECELDAAELLLDRVARVADEGNVSESDTLRAARDCAQVAELLATAVGRLVRSAGTRGQVETCRLQRFARDVTSAATHTMLQFASTASAWAGFRARD
jgi:two-component flavin-dependent monooxygenase